MKFLLFFIFFIPQLSWAIIDGNIITDKSFRQSVALVFKRDTDQSRGEIYCSGTLVGPRVVVTAAHCLKSGAKAMKVSLEDFQKQTWIYVGETHEASDLPMIIPQYPSARVLIHPLNDSIYSDVALIELARDVDVKSWDMAISGMSIPNEKLLKKELIHVGYGQITNDGVKGVKASMSLPLKQLNGYNGLGVGEMYVKSPGACHGDSGGSAFMLDSTGSLKFVGIEYGLSNHPCGESATYFIPLTVKIIDWMKSLNRELFL